MINAQSNYEKKLDGNVKSYMSKVESKIELSSAEKEKLYELKKTHTVSFWKVNKEYKNSPDLVGKKKEVNVAFVKSLDNTFGKERAREIKIAAKRKK